MWIKALTLKNIRSFKSAHCNFSKTINVLIGPNNAGKSTVLLPLLGIQEGLPQLSLNDLRLGATDGMAEIMLDDYSGAYFPNIKSIERLWYQSRKEAKAFPLMAKYNGNAEGQMTQIPNREPTNFIYPFVSKRKVATLKEEINDKTVEEVPSTFQNLYAKIDRLSDTEFQPAHSIYMRACESILGFKITSAHTGQGKRAVYTVYNMQRIPVTSMGEGVMNILGLVVNLAIASGHLFLIEEPENDVHPKALKGLMDLIAEKSDTNQFIITTHSNIVLKKLGAVTGTKIFQINSSFEDRLPTSTVTEVEANAEDRRRILQDLGYEFNDVDFWEGWLFLEESSAEKIIRNYLMPWFTPSLSHRLRTYSAHSLSEVPPRFRDFNELFVFLHLEPAYKNRVWIIVDSGDEESEVIAKLKTLYTGSGWRAEQFRQFSQHQFESYYPPLFSSEATKVNSLIEKKAKREGKRHLLSKVENWIQQNPTEAKEAFAQSASEIITLLKEIMNTLDQ